MRYGFRRPSFQWCWGWKSWRSEILVTEWHRLFYIHNMPRQAYSSGSGSEIESGIPWSIIRTTIIIIFRLLRSMKDCTLVQQLKLHRSDERLAVGQATTRSNNNNCGHKTVWLRSASISWPQEDSKVNLRSTVPHAQSSPIGRPPGSMWPVVQ